MRYKKRSLKTFLKIGNVEKYQNQNPMSLKGMINRL